MDFDTNPDAVIAEADKLIAFAEENKMKSIAAATYNLKGYMLQRTGKLTEGIRAIEKYVELYPDRYNALDSRAEFYLFAGDTANAVVWYKKVLNVYPYSQSAQNKLKGLEYKK